MGNQNGIKFRGTRDLPSLTLFVSESLGNVPKMTKAIPVTTNGLTELTDNSFNDFVQKGKYFVKFYAPWCGFCKVSMHSEK